jgi:hypothetical protein
MVLMGVMASIRDPALSDVQDDDRDGLAWSGDWDALDDWDELGGSAVKGDWASKASKAVKASTVSMDSMAQTALVAGLLQLWSWSPGLWSS